eukprot:gene24975-29972_t
MEPMDTFEFIRSVPTQLFVGGRFVPAENNATFPVADPATGKSLTDVADASPADALRALDEAVAVSSKWASTPARERGEILRAVFEKITERAEDVALLMTLEMGKALAESRAEVKYGAEFFRWFSEEAVRIGGRYTPAPAGNGRILVTKAPLMAEAGLPDGVLSVLPTSKSGEVTGPLIDDPRLRKLTFTGSTGVGKMLVEKSAKRLLRTSMELGGNAPFVVFDDADVDKAVEGAVLAKLRNGGEACTAANRFHVANAVREEFTTKLTEKMATFTMGPGTDPETKLGPLINQNQLDTVAELVADAVDAGAKVRLGGEAPGGEGYFYPATVLADVPASARILKEEVFGPVAAITGFDTEAEGIAAANDTEFGLAAYIFTRDLDRALRVSDALESGMIGVNRGVISDAAAPFGGVKESGFGREGGTEGIEEYLNTKYIALES